MLTALVALAFAVTPAALAAAASGAPSPTGAGGSIGLRLLDTPMSASNDPRARIYIVDRLAPGTVIHRRVEVTNSTQSALHSALYAAAASVADGSFLAAADHVPNELSMWTSVQPGVLDVPARGQATAVVTISVPKDAAPGERYGVVWAETRSAPRSGGGIVEVSRVGIRLYVSIGSGAAPAADFTITSVTAERATGGRPLVRATVLNTGGRALDVSGTLGLANGPGGLSAGPFPSTLGTTVAIGGTGVVTFLLERQLPVGPWEAQLTLHSGLIEHRLTATLRFPLAGVSAVALPTSHRHGWLVPLTWGLGTLMLIAIIIGFTSVRPRGRNGPKHASARHRLVTNNS